MNLHEPRRKLYEFSLSHRLRIILFENSKSEHLNIPKFWYRQFICSHNPVRTWNCKITILLHATYCNTSQHGGQTHATCCAQQRCDMLRWHVAIVWPGLKPKGLSTDRSWDKNVQCRKASHANPLLYFLSQFSLLPVVNEYLEQACSKSSASYLNF